MTVYGAGTPHAWHCRWCQRTRGILRSANGTWGALICPHCDFDHAHATTIPRESEIRDRDPRA